MELVQKLISSLGGYSVLLIVIGTLCCLNMPRRPRFFKFYPFVALAFAILLNPVFIFGFYGALFPYAGLSYFLVYLCACLVLWFGFDIRVSQAFYIGSIAHAAEHFITNFKFLVGSKLEVAVGALPSALILLCFNAAFISLIYFLFFRKMFVVNNRPFYSDMTNYIVAAYSEFILLGISWLSLKRVGSFEEILVYKMIVSTTLLFAQCVFLRIHLAEYEKERLREILTVSEKQERIFNENLQLINKKCHDLKYQISALKSMDDEAQRLQHIEELERVVMIYDSMPKTGNKAFDSIIAERSLKCEQMHITFSYNVDVDALIFMDVVDMAILFGNALDNAIEAVCKLEETKRFISLSAKPSGELLKINIDNYMQGQLTFRQGLPLTSKAQTFDHGIGMQSIQHIVKKYDGHLIIQTEENIFSLNILLNRAAPKTK